MKKGFFIASLDVTATVDPRARVLVSRNISNHRGLSGRAWVWLDIEIRTRID